MFGNEKTSGPSGQKRGATAKDTSVTILTSGCHFTGKLYCRGATRIGGTIEGQVIAEGLLVVEEEASVLGDVDAEDIVIHGRVEGKVEGRNRVEMCSTADVQADVTTPSLVVHDGAQFNGKTTMVRKVAAAQPQDGKGTGLGMRLSGGRKSGQKQEERAALSDIKAARIGDFRLLDLDPEPAI